MENINTNSLVVKIRWLYPIWIVLATFSVAYVPSVIFVQNDIIKTANNISENIMLMRMSIVGTLATGVLMVYISYYLYLLFEKINKNTARLMLIFALICVPLMGFEAFKIISLGSDDPQYVYDCLNLNRSGQIIAEVFWGLWLYPLGKLVIESNYFPKILGYVLMASCWGYLIAVFIKVVFPSESHLLFLTDVLAFGELVFALWFVVKGIRIE